MSRSHVSQTTLSLGSTGGAVTPGKKKGERSQKQKKRAGPQGGGFCLSIIVLELRSMSALQRAQSHGVHSCAHYMADADPRVMLKKRSTLLLLLKGIGATKHFVFFATFDFVYTSPPTPTRRRNTFHYRYTTSTAVVQKSYTRYCSNDGHLLYCLYQ